MKVYLGLDHNGIKIKDYVLSLLKELNVDIKLTKLENNATDDYPDFAKEVCDNVVRDNALGILICGTGIGMSIAANKVKGIRCARVVDENDAYTSRLHNGANVIAFSANLDNNTIKEIIKSFILTSNPVEERHIRRVNKIINMENDND